MTKPSKRAGNRLMRVNRLRILLNIWLACLVFTGHLLAQNKQRESDLSQSRQEVLKKQLEENRVAGLEAEILNDIKNLDFYGESVALGWLGKTLSPYRSDKSLKYFTKAVEILEDTPKEGYMTKERRILATRKLIELIENLSPLLEKRLKDILAGYDSNDEGILIKQIIAAIERGDKSQAIDLWSEGLAKGYKSYQFISLILSFRRLKDNTADILFSQALKLAPQVSEVKFHQGMAFIVFPELESPILKKALVPPDDLRMAYLNILSAFLFNGESQANRCQYSTIAASLLELYKKLDPSKAGAVQIFAQQCKSHVRNVGEQELGSSSEEAIITPDELVAKARKATDNKLRLRYFFKAASRARQDRDLEKAISILDMIEEKADTEGVWGILRRDYTSDLAIEKLTQGDITSFHKILNECPDHLVFFVKIRCIKHLLQKNKPLALSLFQTLGASIDISPKEEHIPAYLVALDLSMALLPSDSIAIWGKLISELDAYDGKLTA